MELCKILESLEYDSKCEYDLSQIDICDITTDSRRAVENTVFICICGAKADGHDFARSAYNTGCRIFVCEHDISLPDDAVIIKTENTRKAIAVMSANFFCHPAEKLKLVGITGTKGKTSITAVASAVLNEAGIKTATIGTNGITIDGKTYPTLNTTPDAYELNKAFAQMVSADVKCAILEVSSQALFLDRVYKLTFDIAVFTNLSPDHIGGAEHPSFEHYMACKAKLFTQCRFGIFNSDDDHYPDMRQNAKCICQTYGIHAPSDLTASDIKIVKDGKMGISFTLKYNSKSYDIICSTPGVFSVYNSLAVLAITSRLGVSPDIAAKTLSSASVPGRFEVIRSLDNIMTIIDYAHNPLSLKNVLMTLRMYEPKRIVCLFGSVGSRTELRRFEMGKVAAEFADFSILTSDNPDREDPKKIISDIAAAFDEAGAPYIAIPDRCEAIKYALDNARQGDFILLAGKGHENYQIINGEKIPFSEKQIIKDYCEEKATVIQ